jgi:hypothetical protein
MKESLTQISLLCQSLHQGDEQVTQIFATIQRLPPHLYHSFPLTSPQRARRSDKEGPEHSSHDPRQSTDRSPRLYFSV